MEGIHLALKILNFNGQFQRGLKVGLRFRQLSFLEFYFAQNELRLRLDAGVPRFANDFCSDFGLFFCIVDTSHLDVILCYQHFYFGAIDFIAVELAYGVSLQKKTSGFCELLSFVIKPA